MGVENIWWELSDWLGESERHGVVPVITKDAKYIENLYFLPMAYISGRTNCGRKNVLFWEFLDGEGEFLSIIVSTELLAECIHLPEYLRVRIKLSDRQRY